MQLEIPFRQNNFENEMMCISFLTDILLIAKPNWLNVQVRIRHKKQKRKSNVTNYSPTKLFSKWSIDFPVRTTFTTRFDSSVL